MGLGSTYDYSENDLVNMKAAQCAIQMPSVKENVENDIIRTEQRLEELKRLKGLLEKNPQFEEMLSLLKRY